MDYSNSDLFQSNVCDVSGFDPKTDFMYKFRSYESFADIYCTNPTTRIKV